MDPSVQYVQQQQQQTVPAESQPYDQSQYQAYDPYSTYQTAQYPQYTQEQYAAYYAQYYATNPYQSQPETTSIQTPGVPVTDQTTYSTGSEQGLGQTYSYYPQTTAGTTALQLQNQAGYGAVPAQGGYRPPMSSAGGGRRGGISNRGGARGGIGFIGRGRGRGDRVRGGHHNTAATSGQPQPAQGQRLPSHMVWCELCRAGCNNQEILELHLNGNRHKKNVQFFEKYQKMNKIMVEGTTKEPECAAKEAVPPGGDQQLAEPNTAQVGPAAVDRGTKRKMKIARGGKKQKKRAADGGPAAVHVPLICELCNVKCSTRLVFDTHLGGKKHVMNMKKFQAEQNLLRQAALAREVLDPALQALIPNVAANVGGGGQGFSLQVHGPQGYGGPAAIMPANGEVGNVSVDPTVVASEEKARVV